jgi:hypothetical protein
MKFRGSTYFITKVYMQQSLYIQDCARKDVDTKISKYFGNKHVAWREGREMIV